MEKQTTQCYLNCFECPYDDCIYEQLTFKDVARQDRFDRELQALDQNILARIERQKRYNATDKGKERQKRYQKTDKFKESQKKYNSSDKGKERYRRYYYKKKLEKLENRKE